MKKITYTTILVFLISMQSLFAQKQQQHDKREKLKAHKTAYITQQLDLTSNEAEKFWPIYNTYENKFFKLKVIKNKETRKKIKEKGGIDALSENEANKILESLNTNEQALIDIKKELYKNLKGVVSTQKILKLYKAEHEFNRKLLSDYRKKNNRPQR